MRQNRIIALFDSKMSRFVCILSALINYVQFKGVSNLREKSSEIFGE